MTERPDTAALVEALACVFPDCPAPMMAEHMCHTPPLGKLRFHPEQWNFACHPMFTAATRAIIAAARAEPEPVGLDVERLLERVATMGMCSQTHHEHLMRDANAYFAARPAAPDR